MVRRSPSSAPALTVLSLLFACTDNAQPDYAKCVQLEAAGDLKGAAAACSAAVVVDPRSQSGKAAAEKLKAVQAKLEVTAAVSTPAPAASGSSGGQGSRAPASAPTATSICANLDAWALNSLDRGFLDCSEIKHVAGAKDDAKIQRGVAGCVGSLAELSGTVRKVLSDPSMDVSKRKSMFAETTDFDDQAASLQATLLAIRSHPALPGEEDVKKGLIADYETVIATFKRWGALMRGYEGNANRIEAEARADFDSGENLIDHVKVNEGMRDVKCIDQAEDGGAAQPGLASVGVTAAPTASPKSVSPDTETTYCPNGLKANGWHFGCSCGDIFAPGGATIQAPGPKRCNPEYPTSNGSACIYRCEPKAPHPEHAQ
jgi:hypothetical protein